MPLQSKATVSWSQARESARPYPPPVSRQRSSMPPDPAPTHSHPRQRSSMPPDARIRNARTNTYSAPASPSEGDEDEAQVNLEGGTDDAATNNPGAAQTTLEGQFVTLDEYRALTPHASRHRKAGVKELRFPPTHQDSPSPTRGPRHGVTYPGFLGRLQPYGDTAVCSASRFAFLSNSHPQGRRSSRALEKLPADHAPYAAVRSLFFLTSCASFRLPGPAQATLSSGSGQIT